MWMSQYVSINFSISHCCGLPIKMNISTNLKWRFICKIGPLRVDKVALVYFPKVLELLFQGCVIVELSWVFIKLLHHWKPFSLNHCALLSHSPMQHSFLWNLNSLRNIKPLNKRTSSQMNKSEVFLPFTWCLTLRSQHVHFYKVVLSCGYIFYLHFLRCH